MGLSGNQLRSNRFATVWRGAYTTGNPDDLMVRARAALRIAGPDSVLGGATVLRLIGVWLPQALMDETQVHVVVPPGQRGPRVRGIDVARMTPVIDPIDMGDVLAVHPAQAWLQVAGDISPADLVVVTDALLRRRSPVATREELDFVLTQCSGRRGVAQARTALSQAREGTQSPWETRLRLAMVDAGLPSPVVNHPLRAGANARLYYLGMAYPNARLAIECDGGQVANRRQLDRDTKRQRDIEDADWRIIMATHADFADLTPVLTSIKTALEPPKTGDPLV